MMQPNRSDVRGFVHKSKFGRAVGGAVGGFIKGGPVGAVAGGVRGFVGGGVSIGQAGCPPGFNLTAEGGCAPRSVTVRAPAFRRFRESFRQPSVAAITVDPLAIVPGGAPFVSFPGAIPFDGGDPGGPGPAGPPGVAVVGRFGAGMEPGIRMQDIRECSRGMVLAVDGLCYNRRDIRNNERFWPRGRRPLLTGGEVRAISTAASAAKKLQRKQKELMKLGLLPKPTARRRAPTAADIHHAKT